MLGLSLRLQNKLKTHFNTSDFKTISKKLKELYLNENLKRSEISKMLSVSDLDVKEILSIFNISKRKSSSRKISRHQMKFYLDKDFTNKKIATVEKTSESYVRKLRRQYGFKSQRPQKFRTPEEYNQMKLSKVQEEIIRGTLLGDSYISNGMFGVYHSKKQNEYLIHLMTALLPIVKPQLREVSKTISGKVFKGFKLESWRHKSLVKLREEYYPKGKKRISKKLASKLTIRSVAYMMMDDGGRSASKRLVLGCSIYKKDIEILRERLEKLFKVDLKVSKQKAYSHNNKKRDLYIIYVCQVDDRFVVAKKLSKFVIPSMKYKIDWVFEHASSKDRRYKNNKASKNGKSDCFGYTRTP
jgi:hypothetical protein